MRPVLQPALAGGGVPFLRDFFGITLAATGSVRARYGPSAFDRRLRYALLPPSLLPDRRRTGKWPCKRRRRSLVDDWSGRLTAGQ